MKILKNFYILLCIFLIPFIIGQSVVEMLLRIYHNFNEHILAGLTVSLLSAGVVTWIPMLFFIEDIDFWKKELSRITLLLCVAGIVAPMLFGIQEIGAVINVLLIFSVGLTVSIVVRQKKY